jgi:hypothetical protein
MGRAASGQGRHAALVLLLAVLAGCAGGVEHHARFARTGAEFAGTVPAVVEESFAITVRNDSQELADVRAGITSPEARTRALATSDRLLGERLAVLRDFNEHAALLRAYFNALGDLATSGVAPATGAATDELVAALGAVDERLQGKLTEGQLFGRPIGPLIPAATATLVRGAQTAALRAELSRHGPAIERELALSEAFLALLRDIALEDLEAMQTARVREEVKSPFRRAGALPKDWAARREAAFKAQLSTPAIARTHEAARDLRQGFVALLEDRLSPASVHTLAAEVAAIVALFKETAA